MFCSRSLNNSLNRIYDDHANSFQDILTMANDKTIHKKLTMASKGNPQISAWFISTSVVII